MGRRGNAGSKIRLLPACILLSPLLLYVVWTWDAAQKRACDCDLLPGKFMWYAPHSGFSNQVGELRNALRIAAILNRTLLLPPVTDHHALSLGSCPKFRIVEPDKLRAAAFAHFRDLLAQSRYYSIAHVVNVSAVSPRFVKTIDFRAFTRFWCGSDSGPASSQLLDECGAKLTQATAECSHCVHDVDDNCATTIWSYRADVPSTTRRVLLGRGSSKLKFRKYDASARVRRDIYQSLGSGSEAGKAKLLAFGSLFSAEYHDAQTHVDLAAMSGSNEFDQVFHASEYLPLSQVILEAGKSYVEQKLKGKAFFCAQLRLLDGQFKNHWSKTFGSLKSSLASLKSDGSSTAVFVMTDLGVGNWTGTYLEQLSNDNKYEVYVVDEKDELVAATARNVLSTPLGIHSSFGYEADQEVPSSVLQDHLLYLQEAICSCASLGFHGTTGSTISESISLLRNAGSCK